MLSSAKFISCRKSLLQSFPTTVFYNLGCQSWSWFLFSLNAIFKRSWPSVLLYFLPVYSFGSASFYFSSRLCAVVHNLDKYTATIFSVSSLYMVQRSFRNDKMPFSFRAGENFRKTYQHRPDLAMVFKKRRRVGDGDCLLLGSIQTDRSGACVASGLVSLTRRHRRASIVACSSQSLRAVIVACRGRALPAKSQKRRHACLGAHKQANYETDKHTNRQLVQNIEGRTDNKS